MRKILLIDSSSTRADGVALRLQRRGFETEVVTDFLFALTMLEWHRPHMIVTWAESSDGMTPAEFCATIKQDSALRSVQTVLVGDANPRSTVSIARFDRVLADDDTVRLAARLAEIAELTQQPLTDEVAPQISPKSSEPFIEDTDADRRFLRLSGFVELLDLLSMSLKSGRIVIHTGCETGPVFIILDNGQMIHAAFGSLEGPTAFRRLINDMARQPEVSYRFESLQRWQVSTFPRSIRQAERQRLLKMAADKDDFETQEIVPLKRAR